MLSHIRHTELSLLGFLLLAGVACGDSQPLPDMDPTVEARMETMAKAIVDLTVKTITTSTQVSSKPTAVPPTVTPTPTRIPTTVTLVPPTPTPATSSQTPTFKTGQVTVSDAESYEKNSLCPAVHPNVETTTVNSVYVCVRPVVDDGDPIKEERFLSDGNINGDFPTPGCVNNFCEKNPAVGYLEGPELAVFHWDDNQTINCPTGVPHCAQISGSEGVNNWVVGGPHPFWGNINKTIETGTAYFRLREFSRNYFDKHNSLPILMGQIEPPDKLAVMLGRPSSLPAQLGKVTNRSQIDGFEGNTLPLASGDLNGDGKKDLIVGIPKISVGNQSEAGRVRVYYGTGDGLGSDPYELDQTFGGSTPETGDMFGSTLVVGDFDGDDYDDLAVGSPYEDGKDNPNSGFVHVFYGNGEDYGTTTTPREIDRRDRSSAGKEVETGDRFGYSLAVGDFNGDGKDDLAVGSPGTGQDSGVVNVFFGTEYGLISSGSIELTQFSAGSDIEEGDQFGFSLTTGNFDGDDYDDLAVGSPNEDQNGFPNSGFVHIFYGPLSDLDSVRHLRINQAYGGGSDIEEGDQFGYSLTTGDFDGDGYDDLVVGSPFEDHDSWDDSGSVDVFFGTEDGLAATRVVRLDQIAVGQLPQDNENFGFSVASGDLNGDSVDDLAVGSPGREVGGNGDAGSVQVFPGGGFGSFPENISVISNDKSGIANDRFGKSIAFVDLLGGDGGDHLLIGSPERGTSQVYLYNNNFPCTGSCMRPWDDAKSPIYQLFASVRPDGRNEDAPYNERPKMFVKLYENRETMSRVQLHEFGHYYNRVFVKKYGENEENGFDRTGSCEETALDEGLSYWYASDFANKKWLGRPIYWIGDDSPSLTYDSVTPCQKTSEDFDEHHLGDIITNAFWEIRELPGTKKDLWTETILYLVDTNSASGYGVNDPTDGGSSIVKGFANEAYNIAASNGIFTLIGQKNACNVLVAHKLRTSCS